MLAHDLDGVRLESALTEWTPRVTILASTTEPAVLGRLRVTVQDTRLLVVGYELSPAVGLQILGAGANCVALGAHDVDVLAAIHKTARGERFFAARDGWRVEPDGAEQLTPRERDVLAFLVQGATYLQIGHALGMSARTAEKHAKSMFPKLGVRGKRELVGNHN
jgi:DNA-binding NarL/FixJ family response regulator